jgi:hypothetical protein
MELRRCWAILRRYLWLIALIFLVVLVGSLLTKHPRPPRYGASMRFVVGIIPQSSGNYYAYDRYYTWLASEYLVDDMAEVVRSRAFADKVASKLSLPSGSLYGSIASESKHRILTVHLSWHDPNKLEEIAKAAADLIQEPGEFFPQLGAQKARLVLIDPPVVYPIGLRPPGPPLCPPPLAEGLPAFWVPLVAGLLMWQLAPSFVFVGGHPPQPPPGGSAPWTPFAHPRWLMIRQRFGVNFSPSRENPDQFPPSLAGKGARGLGRKGHTPHGPPP